MGRAREKRRIEERKIQKKEDTSARNVRKVAKYCVFRLICGAGCRLAKTEGAEPSGQMRTFHCIAARWTFTKSKCAKHLRFGPLLEVGASKKLHAVVARSTFPSQSVRKGHQVRTTFGSSDAQKLHSVAARSTFPSQNVKSTAGSDCFGRPDAERAPRRHVKRIPTSKCTKYQSPGPLLEDQMPKKCAPSCKQIDG